MRIGIGDASRKIRRNGKKQEGGQVQGHDIGYELDGIHFPDGPAVRLFLNPADVKSKYLPDDRLEILFQSVHQFRVVHDRVVEEKCEPGMFHHEIKMRGNSFCHGS